MRQLYPPPGNDSTSADGSGTGPDTDIASAYAHPLGSAGERPWVSLCMVASIDGSTVVDGASAGLSSPNDGKVLAQLRSIADVVIVGAGTARDEGYGPPKKPGQRIGVVTASGSVDTSTDLFTSGAGFVITTVDADVDGAVDTIRCGRNAVDLADALRRIPALCPGAAVVQAEGGPTLNGALAAADLLDEVNLTTSPAIFGGTGLRLVRTEQDLSQRYVLEQLLIDDEMFVFTRWRRNR